MSDRTGVDRRTVLRSTGGLLAAGALAGCGGDNGNGGDANNGSQNTVAVGPNNQFRFDPEEITISVGDTVTWEFESASHNVCGWPEMHETVAIPEGADGFGSMPQDGNRFDVVDSGQTYEHTFETAGEYTYVCVPHASNMIGTVIVE